MTLFMILLHLRNILFPYKMCVKVQVFLESHKILQNLHLRFGCTYVVNIKSKLVISQNFVTF